MTPETKLRGRTRLFLTCGLPCSGKSTLAGQIAAATGAVVFSPDRWMIELEVDLWEEGFRGRLEHIMSELAEDLLAKGQSVVLDYGYWRRSERDEKRLRARQLGVDAELCYLDEPIEELIRRVEERSETGVWSKTAPITREHIQKWWGYFDRPDSSELALFDPPVSLAP